MVDLAAGGQRRRVRLVLLEDLDDRLAPPGGLGEQRGRVGQVVGAEHDVDVAGPLDDQLPVLLGQAAADRDLEARAAPP